MDLTFDELSALFAWMVDAQEFLPVPEKANEAIDKLITYQRSLKHRLQSLQQLCLNKSERFD